jgi:hypothetical protein
MIESLSRAIAEVLGTGGTSRLECTTGKIGRWKNNLRGVGLASGKNRASGTAIQLSVINNPYRSERTVRNLSR